MHVLPVTAKVRAVPLEILAVLVDVRLIACDVALLVPARALLGVFLPQVALIGAQVRAIPLDVLTVCADVRPVAADVAPVTAYIITILAAVGLTARLLIASLRARSNSRGVHWHAGL